MKYQNPHITVVTVCYNVIQAGRLNSFRNCIESVNSQTYKSAEHIIVDGGSNDGTIDVIREYERPGLRWLSEKDKGIYDAMNKGIRLARGTYIAFINTDDMLSDNGAVAAVKEAFDKTDADFIYANANVYSADHSQLIRTWKSRIDDIPYGYYPCHQTIFCRTDVLREIGGFTEKYMANDNLLMLRLVDRYKASYLDRVIVNFHEGGASGAMIADKDRMKEETVSFFYDEVGRKSGLSREECGLLYEKQSFLLPEDQSRDIGSRLGLSMWIRRYFEIVADAHAMEQSRIAAEHAKQLIQKDLDSHRIVRVRLFGKMPLFRIDV